MPQTDPFTYNAPKKMTDAELARALRLDAAAELDAMNLYEAHIEATDNEDAKKVLAFIAKDEKEHYALFAELIRRLDPDQAEEMEGASAKLDVILSAPPGAASEEAVEAADQGGSGTESVADMAHERDRLRQPTVGSLFGRFQE
jgi:uncharacterized protein